MEQIYNPYLPLNEYIPDGEPHVYDGRLYIYGSHDRSQGSFYCEDHYEVWSAPVDNLRDWRSEGVSYLRTQDPSNKDDTMQMWAPDVTRGPDGKYYLYYCLGMYPEIGVAVSDSPAGPFAFYGHVHYPEHILGGKLLQEDMVFDPAVLTDDDGRVYLYYGFAPACEKEMLLPEFTEEELAMMPPAEQEKINAMKTIVFGENSMVAELEPDMVTLKEAPRVMIPGGHHTEGTGFEGHGFFEASSIRKINGTYYFVYSSHKSHELCYAVSKYPDRDFRFGGILVSNGDIGLNGRENPVYPLSNNHGGLVQVGNDLYVFYHKATQCTEFSRQGCAEKVTMMKDGSIPQVEITSCGLNGGPLAASGSYPASIACHLTDPTVGPVIDYQSPVMKEQVCITQLQNQNFITRIKNGTTVGYKYFDFKKETPGTVLLELRGDFRGTVRLSHAQDGAEPMGEMKTDLKAGCWTLCPVKVHCTEGTKPFYIHFEGEGNLDMRSFAFMK